MFPYLKSKDDFIKDCEKMGFAMENRPDGYDIAIKKGGFYSKTRGCKQNADCFGCDDKSGCTVKTCYSAKDCSNISELVAWIYTYCNKANWGKKISNSEISAWCQSLGVFMHDILKKVDRNIAIGIEYYIEDDSNDGVVDMMIGGYGPKGEKRVVVLELKQWSNIVKWYKASNTCLCDIEYNGKKLTNFGNHYNNPLNSVKNYCEKIREIIGSKAGSKKLIELIPCVYMHNMTGTGNNLLTTNNDSGVYYGEDKRKFIEKLNEMFSDDMNTDPVSIFEELKRLHKPHTVDDMVNMLLKRKDCAFVSSFNRKLRPDQKSALDNLRDDLNNTAKKNNKKLDILYGGPGSGKTVIAFLLMRYCIDKNLDFRFYYQSNAPKNAYDISLMKTVYDDPKWFGKTKQDQLKNLQSIIDKNGQIKLDDGSIIANDTKYKRRAQKAKSLREKFIYYRDDENEDGKVYDLIIFDEFQKFSGDYKDFKNIISKANMVVILMDERQTLNKEKDRGDKIIKKIGNKSHIEDNRKEKVEIRKFEKPLWTQFRCNQDEGYVSWIEGVLQIGIKDTAPVSKHFRSSIKYSNLDYKPHILSDVELKKLLDNPGDDLYIVTNVDAVKEAIDRIKELNCSADFPNQNQRNGELSASVKNRYYVGDPTDVIGLEYERILVIMGEDIQYNCSKNKVCSDTYIKNAYRFLLTRGMRECYIYCIDDKLRDHFKRESLK